MRSEIRNIRFLAKSGAFGRNDAVGFYIYGKRRDGRTVPCKSEIKDDGGIEIFSSYATDGPYMEEDMTEFSADEWHRVKAASGHAASRLCNEILDARK